MLKVLFVVGLAYLLKRLRLFKEEDSKVLISYVINFSLPFLAFRASHQLGLNREVLTLSILAWMVIISCLLLSYTLAKWMKFEERTLRSFVLASSFGNTAFLGYPTAESLLGQKGLSYAVVYDSLGSFVLVSTLGFLIASGRWDPMNLLRFPPFLGLVLGFLSSPFALPKFLADMVSFVADSTLVVVLFSIGLMLSFSQVRNNLKYTFLALSIKMIFSSFVAILLGKLMGIQDIAYKVAVLESAMPTMITASVLAMMFDLNYHLAFASATLGIIFYFILIPLLVKVL
ncbi:AEC family transporter [Thermocrinis minervae]|uniref:ABC transmembrane type-1 domain-containing protein n=1 Tax=Thermocrinis minervae TaxID=381751 RepID=A0A1M6SUZ3_9AQUI|nr:AEC family transporter [Thermocrinis minervae]SHK48534.1 hypothetical protein SAMN05444391_1178 [Thermocrinis minervae]